MSAPDFHALLASPTYDFLRTEDRLGSRIMLLALSGSYGYGTNREGSDVDFRGITQHLPSDLLGLTQFEQYTDANTDTVIYGFNKFIHLLIECNPNILELMGLPAEKYLILSPQGKELLANTHLFLSRKAIRSYRGFANAQMRRLQNAIARDKMQQTEKEKHILNSVLSALDDVNQRNPLSSMGDIRLFIDQSTNSEFETEIFIDAAYTHLPLRLHNEIFDTMRNVVGDYDKVSRRLQPKDESHLCKHAMHLIRILKTGTDILNKGEVITYRQADLPLLLSIRSGDYLKDDQMIPEFFEIAEEAQREFDEAAATTNLPDSPDLAAIELLMERLNRQSLSEEFQ